MACLLRSDLGFIPVRYWWRRRIYRALQNQVRELHRLLGKKTLETEILKEALEQATRFKKMYGAPHSQVPVLITASALMTPSF